MDVRVYSSGERRVLRRFTARIVISRASTCRPSVHFGAGTVEGDAIPGSRTRAPLFFPSRAHKRTLPGVFWPAARRVAPAASRIRRRKPAG